MTDGGTIENQRPEALSMPLLNTRRLLLRPMLCSDAFALHPWMCDAEVMRYWSTPPHADEATTIRWVNESVAAMRDGTGIEYVIVAHEQVVGRVALFNNSDIGYFFGRPYWNRGYAGEALRAFVDFVFDRCGIEEIHADVDPRNIASLRLLERLDFRQTGSAARTICVNGEWADSIYLTLSNPASAP